MSKQAYPVVFTPIPLPKNEAVYFDHTAVPLPCTDDFQTLHYHNRYEIGLCEEGEGVFLFEDGVSCISKGDVVFIAPGRRHYSRSLSKDCPCFCRFVYIDIQTMESLMSLICTDKKSALITMENANKFISPIINHTSNPREVALLTELVSCCEAGEQDFSALVQLRLALFILEAHKRFTKPATVTEKKQTTDRTISAIAEYISINYDKISTIYDLIKICHLSESQLRRRFIKVYSIPPIAYKNQLRCQIAADLLFKTQLSISEISSRVGYTDISDFYRAFKKSYGVSPTTYRNSLQFPSV